MNSAEIFLALIKSAVFDENISDSVASHITEPMQKFLYKCAKAHDLSAIIYTALTKNSISLNEDIDAAFKQQQLLSAYRYQCMNSELQKITELFEAENIPFVPLKGAMLRELYPEPYLRTSCDIDVLVREGDIEHSVGLLTEKTRYKSSERNYHDYSLHSENGVHLELHFSLLENKENIDRLLSRPWDFAKPCDGSYRYSFTNEFVVFYAVAHMSYHFMTGGCGIRPFIDLYLMEKKLDFDKASLEKMFCECGIDKFYNYVKKLCLVWFENEEHDEITREMERFILSGGVNGNHKKSIVASQQRKGGKSAFFRKRIIQPYNIMKEKYPILKDHKYLLPFYQMKRWASLLRSDKIARFKKEYNADKSISAEQANEMNIFLSKLDLK